MYQVERSNAGASPSTVNWEKGTLSKIFQVLIDLRLVETNPVRLVKNLSQKSEERQVYISFQDVQRVIELSPAWLKPIVQTAYFTGMRRGEILGLSAKQVKLSLRLILLGPENTKEGHWKRVPIHRDLVPILEAVLKVRTLATDKVFLVDGKSPHKDTIKHAWRRAVKDLNLDSRPRLHDLRHTWRANARRSGVDPAVAESIMGHWFRGRSVNERYGRISDSELIQAIDSMAYDNGETEILVAGRRNR